MPNSPDVRCVLKILSIDDQSAAPKGHFLQVAGGKIGRMPRFQPTVPICEWTPD
jgi:hypothetical protein